jgi:hypothetical protein
MQIGEYLPRRTQLGIAEFSDYLMVIYSIMFVLIVLI